ncbi:MAG: sigma-70 family RNA polymerase sigma factor [Oscillospiraceae bacterium]|nr:sigma-70 family RNA polymerase sigma factor [Oscillospiraceae bacterium]
MVFGFSGFCEPCFSPNTTVNTYGLVFLVSQAAQYSTDGIRSKLLNSDLDTEETLGEEMIPSGRISNPVEQAVMERLLIEQLYAAIARLDEYERELIAELYFADKSQSQLSKETGISQQLISYRAKQTIKKLRFLLDEKLF